MPATPVRRPYAFTLIELLVVVAIIAMLISILLPSLSKARSMARMVKCASIQKQFGTAHHMYANESDDWFVPHTLNGTRLAWYRNIKWRANLSLSPGSNYPDGLVSIIDRQLKFVLTGGELHRRLGVDPRQLSGLYIGFRFR